MEYCYDICTGADQFSLTILDRVQNHLRILVGDKLSSTLQRLSHKHGMASFSQPYCHFHGKSSAELHSLVPPVVNFIARIPSGTYIVANYPHCLRIPLVITTGVWNRLTRRCYTDQFIFACFVMSFATSSGSPGLVQDETYFKN